MYHTFTIWTHGSIYSGILDINGREIPVTFRRPRGCPFSPIMIKEATRTDLKLKKAASYGWYGGSTPAAKTTLHLIKTFEEPLELTGKWKVYTKGMNYV